MKNLKGLAAIVAVLGSLGCASKGVTSLPANPKPSAHNAFGVYLGLPELAAFRYVHGWDKKCGFQANIGPVFGSADVRVNTGKLRGGNIQGYGLLGVCALMPWVKDYAEEEPTGPTYCPEVGVCLEKGKNKGNTLGLEFALVLPLEKQEEESGTVGFRFGVSVVRRY